MNVILWTVTGLAVGRSLLTTIFVLTAGVIQGRTTGTYPTVSEWTAALRDAQPAPRTASTIGGRYRARSGNHRATQKH